MMNQSTLREGKKEVSYNYYHVSFNYDCIPSNTTTLLLSVSLGKPSQIDVLTIPCGAIA
jgi:hypothetical protein